ncbi:MAG: hypothetical protein ACI9R3_001625 [Verrucomicrobiales bacterium]|jgi:hypothetical protein
MRATLESIPSTTRTQPLPASVVDTDSVPKIAAVSQKRALIKGLLSFTCFAIALWQGDYWGGKALEHLYFQQQSGDDWNTTVSLMHSTADIEIFGDSRGCHHYNPQVIEDTLGKSMACHNSSRNAQTILYSNTVANALIDRHRPQAIILDLNPVVTLGTAAAAERLSVLLPYYDRVPAVRPVIDARSKHEHLKLLSRCYRFNSKLPTLLKHMLDPEPSDLKGHHPLIGQLPSHAFQLSPDQPSPEEMAAQVDPLLEQALRGMITRANAANIPVILISSPIYQLTFERACEALALEAIHGLNFKHWDYLEDSRFYGQKNKFYDRTHLNTKAADEFSAIIAERLKTVLKPPFVAQLGRH